MTKKKPSAYKLLGLGLESFTLEELKQAYREKARQHHPDRIHDDDPEKEAEKRAKATELFKKVKKAYEELAKKHFRCSKNVYDRSDDEDDTDQYIVKRNERRTVHLFEFMPNYKSVAPTGRAYKKQRSKRKGKDDVDSDEERSLEAERRAEEQASQDYGIVCQKSAVGSGIPSTAKNKMKACARGPEKLTDEHKLLTYCQICCVWFVNGMQAFISHKLNDRHKKWLRLRMNRDEIVQSSRKAICGYHEDDGSLRISCDSCNMFFLSPEHFARHHEEIGAAIEQ